MTGSPEEARSLEIRDGWPSVRGDGPNDLVPDGPPEGIRAFLIADVRGYTAFTQTRGDEAAGALAARFAGIAREIVEGRTGHVVELRGDEALAVFASPRQAIRAAVDLQQRLVDETQKDPTLPLPVGIGLDAGEAVAVEGGYRGGALNLAARLCSVAGPGEIIASREIVHLARKVEGVRFLEPQPLRLKGMDQPVQAHRIVPEGRDPAVVMRRYLPEPPVRSRAWRRLHSPFVLAPAGIAVAIAVALLIVATRPNAVPPTPSPPPAVAVEDNSISLVDLASGRVTLSKAVGPQPGAIVSDGGALWIANVGNGTVVRVDPTLGTAVQTIKTGLEPTAIAAGAGSIWVVVDRSRSVLRINPATNSLVATIEVGNGPRGIAVGEGAVWVTNSLDDSVAKIDVTSGKVTGVFPVDGTPLGIAVGDGGVWVANSTDASVTRLDPASGRLVATIRVGNGPRGIATGEGAVWVTNSLDGTVSRIDPTANAVSGTVQVGPAPAGLTVTADAVFVASELSDSVSELDPTAGTLTRTLKLGHASEAAAVAPNGLWVTVRQSPTDHRGGTFTWISDADIVGTVDPAFANAPGSATLLGLTNDGLLGFRRTGGTDGNTLVPDLAVAIPTPTDGGLTYTFSLRAGILYSNRQAVRASDVRASAERFFKGQSPFAFEFDAIKGADACLKAPSGCDLSMGIEADDQADVVTFHLSRTDPDFPYELAALSILPAGLPATDQGTNPVPGTGPYMFESYEPGKRIELVRNPAFHQWSPARPDGYVDAIVVQMDVAKADLEAQVVQGMADYVWARRLAPDARSEMLTLHPELVHEWLRPADFHFFLNTRVAPFDDQRVRQAVNYAVDRSAALRAYPDSGLVTCQVLPPSFPGYAPYCPYTVNPNGAGSWTGPDLAKAKELVAASGTSGTPITVWELPNFADTGQTFVDALVRLGYKATLKVAAPDFDLFGYVFDSANKVQSAGYWESPSVISGDSFMGLFGCSSFIAKNGVTNQSDAEFCDPQVDAMIEHAREVQVADPAAAGSEWAKVDQAVTDRAPWVSVFVPGVREFTAARVGNYQANSVGALLDQLWVQ